MCLSIKKKGKIKRRKQEREIISVFGILDWRLISASNRWRKMAESLGPSARQFMEELFVESLVGFFRSHRQKDVAADELVHHFTIGR